MGLGGPHQTKNLCM